MALSVAFVLTFGEAREDFFPDSLLGLLCARARKAGHRASLLRAYYHGTPDGDRDIAGRIEEWLARQEADVVVLERLFDPAPIRRHVAGMPHRRGILVTRGDSVDAMEGIHYVIGGSPGVTRTGRTRRTPTVGELALALDRVLESIEAGVETLVAGVARIVEDRSDPPHLSLIGGLPGAAQPFPRPFEVVLDEDVISPGPVPPVTRKTLFGNMGCPYGEDPMTTTVFQGVPLPLAANVARLGCSFCAMGGDYEKRPDQEVVDALVEQATYFAKHAPAIREFVLNDQHAIRTIARVLRAAHAARVPASRWLFPARPDSFVRERARLEDIVVAARETGHQIEVYLSGFEAFSDTELERYNKGCTTADLLAAVTTMRALAREHPDVFRYNDARGHSLILWNPWTTPESLGESVQAFRRYGLAELFTELARNRLRLYPDLPLYYLAERDGALADAWEDEGGAGRKKGYNVEHPWRFLDPRTRIAHDLAKGIRELLGSETEVAQLAAVVEYTRDRRAADVRRVMSDVAELHALLERLGGRRTNGEPSRGAIVRATPVVLAGNCNNGCAACANLDRYVDDDVGARIDAARAEGHAIAIAGREPTLNPLLGDCITRAAGDDRRLVGVVTNGRRFAYAAYTAAMRGHGLGAASVKVFGARPATADAVARATGAHEESLRGLRLLRQHGVATEVRFCLYRHNVAEADVVAEIGAPIRLDVALDAIGLADVPRAIEAVTKLAARCAQLGVGLEVTPLSAGVHAFGWLPQPR